MSSDVISEGKRFGLLGGGDANKGEITNKELRDALGNCRETVTLFSGLCLGHKRVFQDLLRAQPFHASYNYDFIVLCISIFSKLADSQNAVAHFCIEEQDLVRELLLFLRQAMLGPCSANQQRVVKSDVIVAVNTILPAINQSERAHATLDPKYVSMRAMCYRLLAACLEGRLDDTVHVELRRRVAVPMLLLHAREEEDFVLAQRKAAQRANKLLDGDALERVHVALDTLAAMWKIYIELYPSRSMIRLLSAAKGKDGNGNLPTDNSGEAAKPLIGVVEVLFQGRIERTCFPVPVEIQYLTDQTKDVFLDQVRLQTQEARLKLLIEEKDVFMAEMEHVHSLSVQSPLYRLVKRKFYQLKTLCYSAVILLNINVLMSPPSLKRPYELISSGNYKALSDSERNSLGITVVLGTLNFFGYCTSCAPLKIG